MVNLDTVRVALFDFDDTLCSHPIHLHNDGDFVKYWKKVKKYGISAWDKCYYNKSLKKLIHYLVKRGCHVGMISVCEASFLSAEKHKWANENYGVGFADFNVNSSSAKITMLDLVADIYHIMPEEILLIDDNEATIIEAEKLGYQTAVTTHAINIADRLEE